MDSLATTFMQIATQPRNNDVAGASMIFIMRVVLAVSALLTLFIAPDDMGAYERQGALTWVIFIGYLLHSATLLVAVRYHGNPFWHGKVVYWLDLGWYCLMIYCTGGGSSYFYPFFFFVILTSSFQWGFDEGARITLAAAVALTVATWLANNSTNQGQLW